VSIPIGLGMVSVATISFWLRYPSARGSARLAAEFANDTTLYPDEPQRRLSVAGLASDQGASARDSTIVEATRSIAFESAAI
jgi:hypothetical protein